jgi:galactose mutarotase-like enzyme
VNGADLDVALDIMNTGDEELPASVGAHPAFNWPLMPGVGKETYPAARRSSASSALARLRQSGGFRRRIH